MPRRRGLATRAKHACGSLHGKREASLRAPVSPARTSPCRAPRHRGPLAIPSPSPGPASAPHLSPFPGLRPPLCPPGAGERHKAGAPPAAVPRPQTKARGGAARRSPGPAPWGGGGSAPAVPVNQPCWGTPGGAPSSPTPGGAALPRDTSRRCREGKAAGAGIPL